jgi:hypothetical protein
MLPRIRTRASTSGTARGTAFELRCDLKHEGLRLNSHVLCMYALSRDDSPCYLYVCQGIFTVTAGENFALRLTLGEPEQRC